MKMRKFSDGGETIDDGNEDRLGDFIKSKGLDRVPVNEVAADERVVTDDMKARTSPAAASKSKPAIVTLQQLNAFKAKYGADKDLTDYMNDQAGGLKRKNAPSPKTDTPVERGLPAMSSKERSAAISQIPLDDERKPIKGESASGSELGRNVKNTLNAMAGFKGVQLGQAAVEGLATPRAVAAAKGLMGGKQAAEVRRIEPTMSTASAAKKAELAGELRRGATPTNFTSPSKTASAKRTRKMNDDEVGVEFRKGGSAKGYASGGVVSASRRGDGIAQRGKTRGRMC
jgi:hypothetical protein